MILDYAQVRARLDASRALLDDARDQLDDERDATDERLQEWIAVAPAYRELVIRLRPRGWVAALCDQKHQVVLGAGIATDKDHAIRRALDDADRGEAQQLAVIEQQYLEQCGAPR